MRGSVPTGAPTVPVFIPRRSPCQYTGVISLRCMHDTETFGYLLHSVTELAEQRSRGWGKVFRVMLTHPYMYSAQGHCRPQSSRMEDLGYTALMLRWGDR